MEACFERIEEGAKLIVVFAFFASFLCLAEENRPVDGAEVGVQSLHRAIAHA